jgi:hypothetical protein
MSKASREKKKKAGKAPASGQSKAGGRTGIENGQ